MRRGEGRAAKLKGRLSRSNPALRKACHSTLSTEPDGFSKVRVTLGNATRPYPTSLVDRRNYDTTGAISESLVSLFFCSLSPSVRVTNSDGMAWVGTGRDRGQQRMTSMTAHPNTDRDRNADSHHPPCDHVTCERERHRRSSSVKNNRSSHTLNYNDDDGKAFQVHCNTVNRHTILTCGFVRQN